MKHFGFTGTQEGCTPVQLAALKGQLRTCMELGYTWMHNGDCVGCDQQAAMEWWQMGGSIHLHPPINNSKRAFFGAVDSSSPPKDYRARNQDIVDCSEILIACPKEMKEQLRSGTWMTIRMARRQGKKIIYVWPNGLVSLNPL